MRVRVAFTRTKDDESFVTRVEEKGAEGGEKIPR